MKIISNNQPRTPTPSPTRIDLMESKMELNIQFHAMELFVLSTSSVSDSRIPFHCQWRGVAFHQNFIQHFIVRSTMLRSCLFATILVLAIHRTTATSCDACGASTTYSEAITTSGSYQKRTITTNGCPNHYSYCTGKSGLSGCGAEGVEGSGTEATDMGKTLEIPAVPVIAASTTSVECSMGEHRMFVKSSFRRSHNASRGFVFGTDDLCCVCGGFMGTP